MRIGKHAEWVVAVAAFLAAIASIVIALFLAPTEPARAGNRPSRAESTRRTSEEGRERRMTDHADSVEVRVDESRRWVVACRFEDGVPLRSGRVERDGAVLGEVASDGRAGLVVEPREGERLAVVSDAGPIPARIEGGDLVATCGFFLAASCEAVGAGPTRYVVECGKVDPRDQADWEAERIAGGVAPAIDDLYLYSTLRRGEFDGDRFGPEFVACDLGDRRFRLVFGRGVAAVAVEIPEPVAHGALVDLGTVALSRHGSLAIAIEHGEGLPLELSFARVEPEGRAAPADHLLGCLAPASFEALHSGVPLAVDERRSNVSLAPLESGAIDVVLRRIDGPRLASARVTIESERETTLVLDAAPLREPAAARFVLRFAPDGAPIAGARVALSDPTGRHSASATTDGGGECRLPDPATLGFPSAPIVVVESFDETAPERRVVLEVPDPNPAGARVLSIPRRKELRAVGLTAPAGAPRERPLAYSVEIARPGESFVPYAVEEFREGPDAITAFVTAAEVQYRFVAHYSAIFAYVSAPVAMLESDTRVETTFAPMELAPAFVCGLVADAAGAGLARVVVEATSGTSLPPEIVETDRTGRFVIGPVVADEIEIRTSGASRRARAPFREDLVLDVR